MKKQEIMATTNSQRSYRMPNKTIKQLAYLANQLNHSTEDTLKEITTLTRAVELAYDSVRDRLAAPFEKTNTGK